MCDRPINILIDSGSSVSFLSSALADQLPQLLWTPTAAAVKVANGGIMQCSASILACPWIVSSCHFQQDLKLLPLDDYDLILGMDWLEKYSPMKVDWKHKWLCIPYKGSSVLLQGISSDSDTALVIQILLEQLQAHSVEPLELPSEISILLQEFHEIFATPSELPPTRACDHAIPLVPGAQPVNIQPYWYPPILKDEIKKIK